MRQNLILITIDCLRADHCGFMGYTRPTTPTLDELARQSIVFENAQVAGVPTYYSFPAIMASRYPLSLGRDVLGVPSSLPTLATVLRAAGYRTAGFNAGNPYLSHWFGYDQGFEMYDDFGLTEPQPLEDSETSTASDLPLDRRLNRWLARLSARVPIARELYAEFDFRYCYHQERKKYIGAWDKARRYPDAAQVTQRVVAWLNTQAQSPFFLWVHYMDMHQPRYVSPQVLAEIGSQTISKERQFFLNYAWLRPAFGSRYLDDLRVVYDASLRAVDDQVDVILRELQRSSGLDQCTVAVLSDHGEAFFERRDLGHAPLGLFQELLHVPLIIHAPGYQRGYRVTIPFGTVDLAPTLLEILGLPKPDSFQGTSRWTEISERRLWHAPVISETVITRNSPLETHHWMRPRTLAVRYEQHKLILNFADQSAFLFDLVTDPGEQSPLPPGQGRPFRRLLLTAAREHLQRMYVRQDEPLRLRAHLANLRQRLERESTQPR
jgi:arylsulfatase A-like enzyme